MTREELRSAPTATLRHLLSGLDAPRRAIGDVARAAYAADIRDELRSRAVPESS